MRAYRSVAALLAITALIGCARHAPPPLAASQAAPPAAAPDRPADLPATMKVPSRRADGQYATINRDLSAAATLWHVRSALNVAALGCRDANEAAMVAGYNRLLNGHKAALAAADKAVRAEFRAREPGGWQKSHDEYLTRLYNFFAQPFGGARFCAEALALAAEAGTLAGPTLAAWAPGALGRLEAPFTDAYARYDDWQTRYAAWQGGRPAAPPRLAYGSMNALLMWSPAGARPIRTAAIR